jgi:hypothetical protein
MKSRLNFSQPTHPIHSIGPKTNVLGCLGPFCYCMKVDTILDELAPLTPKFAKWSSVAFFRNERMWSTPLDPKLMFWGFRTDSLQHESLCKTRRTGAINVKFTKWSCVGFFRNERARSTPLDPKLMFWGVSDRFVNERRCKPGRTSAINAQVR